MQAGHSAEKVRAILDYRRSPLFDERERLALRYAEAITRSDLNVEDDLFARVREAFGVAGAVELTAAVAWQNFNSKFNGALRVDPNMLCPFEAPVARRAG